MSAGFCFVKSAENRCGFMCIPPGKRQNNIDGPGFLLYLFRGKCDFCR